MPDVYIYDAIGAQFGGVTAREFVQEINSLHQPLVNLHLNTPGGDVFDGIDIFNAIKNHPAQFHAYIGALAASIGTVIAMAAERIVIAPHARMMIHGARIMPNHPLSASEFEALRDRAVATNLNIAGIYAERTGRPVDHWLEVMQGEQWYTDEEAVAAGVADEVGRSNDKTALRAAASFDLSGYDDGERIAAMLRDEIEAPDEAEESAEEPPAEEEPEPIEDEPNSDEPLSEENTVSYREARHQQVDAYLAAIGV